MIRAAIFDLDGTLLDTLGDLHAAVNVALAAFHLPPRTLDEVRAFVGNGVRDLMKRAIPEGEAYPRFEECLAAFRAHYSAHSTDLTCPYAGIPALLADLRRRGIATAIVSNKFDGAVKALAQHYFPDLIDEAVGESPDRQKKPAPDTVLAVMDALAVRPEEAVLIGDSDVDILTAKNAEVASVGVLWGFRDKECLKAAGATRLATTVEELQSILLAL